ncbi:guanosine monophosphate reductase (plasmid) [Borreliella spielmanii]|uniref:Inosine-5'-monophosphate dehydrogenase n=1 Tax=Borreliella spielmanii A14S TaxID=498742 RepID=C0RBW8_9SPIR|nr:guanosine monophosphate reductase [Borreliella spielmanii]ACN53234.1 inosine-5'-monophosphate dehydrogenase [Borreliella spielmanii A14S]WKC82990.1 guanosine monophosphate reductase [Borreliella spielmanii]
MTNKIIKEALTFDDVSLIPRKSSVLPSEVCLKTQLTKNISLNIPFLSSAMDTVTESRMAIAIAKEGGIGIIHKNMSIEAQKKEIEKVKTYKAQKTNNNNKYINEQATKMSAKEDLEEPKIHKNAEHKEDFPNACKDLNSRLRVGAAVSIDIDTIERVEELVKAHVDLLVIDSAHGHSTRIIELVKTIKNKYPNLDLIAGNIVTKEAALDLINAGADCLKVGIGPGSICTTRIVAGVGVPQITAICDVYEICKNTNICIIADGGIRFSGDVVKAIAAGADSVMIGNLFAGVKESPSEEIIYNEKKFKSYVGMGSITAMKRGSKSRYFQLNNNEPKKLVPEGIEGMVPYSGKLKDILAQLKGGLMSGMGYIGAITISDLKINSKFVKISHSSLKESHPHDVFNMP